MDLNDNISDEQIKSSKSKSLAVWVIVYRTIGANKELSLRCMQELARRREECGDDFDYEGFIEEEVKKFPKPEKMDIAKLLKMVKNKEF
jgi:hypothetical protein